MDYVIIGAGAWLGASVLAAAGWSRFYARVAAGRPGLDATPEIRSPRDAAHVNPSRPRRGARAAIRRAHSQPIYA